MPSQSRNLLVIRVNYSDVSFVSATQPWQQRIFGNNEGELAHYMQEISAGNFRFIPASESEETPNDGVITITLTTVHPDSGSDSTIHPDLAQALRESDKYIDFSQYDSDNNGYIDKNELIPMFIIAGEEDAYSGGSSAKGVWAHQSCTSGSNSPILDGVTLMSCFADGNYALFGERDVDSPTSSHDATVGIMAHELGHATFDLPDLYDTTNKSAGIGYFGLMSAGMWGQKSYNDLPGNTPTHMCAWSKIASGFIAPDILEKGSNVAANFTQASSNDYNVLKLPINAHEYYLVENRYNQGYDRGLFALNKVGTFKGGLAIWHIDENTLTTKMPYNIVNNDKNHKGVDLVEAYKNELDFDSQAQGNVKNLFFKSNRASFTNELDYDQQPTNITITNISESSEVMSAIVTNPNSEN